MYHRDNFGVVALLLAGVLSALAVLKSIASFRAFVLSVMK
jgi:hypothetical protein